MKFKEKESIDNKPDKSKISKYLDINLKHKHSKRDRFTEDRYRQFYKNISIGWKKILDMGCNTGGGLKELKP